MTYNDLEIVVEELQSHTLTADLYAQDNIQIFLSYNRYKQNKKKARHSRVFLPGIVSKVSEAFRVSTARTGLSVVISDLPDSLLLYTYMWQTSTLTGCIHKRLDYSDSRMDFYRRQCMTGLFHDCGLPTDLRWCTTTVVIVMESRFGGTETKIFGPSISQIVLREM